MKVLEIYRKFGVPPNLQEHMLRVYGVTSYIEKHWQGEKIDWDLAKKIALLHDLGNVVKFDFDKHPEFLGDEQVNLGHWKEVQRQVIEKYGQDDHEVTRKMLEEIGTNKEAIEVILSKSFGESVKTKTGDNWLLKILYYADLRTLPFGIGTLEERINDVRERMPKYTSRPDFEDLVSACYDIEKQIQRNLNVPVSRITDDVIKIDPTVLEEFEI